MKALLIALLMIGTVHAEEGFFVEGGLAVHSLGTDCPEYCGANPLGSIGAGWTFNPGQHVYVDALVSHTSSIADTEDGLGQNTLEVRARWYPGK